MANNDSKLSGDSTQWLLPSASEAKAGSRVADESATRELSTKPIAATGAPSAASNGQLAKPARVVLKPDSKAPAGPQPVVSVRNLKKTYMLGQTSVRALRGISLDLYPGEFVAIMGPSGSGKSTFMNLIGCLDRPSEGQYWLIGKLVSTLSNDELADVRNRLIGFVFQGFNLLSRATALSNVAMPMLYAGFSKQEREARAAKVLKLVGLGSRMHHRPSQLSGGQQQRVAIARALVNGPSLLMADEPTGNLDSRTSIEIMAIMQALNEQGLTIILVTHESDIASYAKRRVVFRDGRVVSDEPVVNPRSAVDEWNLLTKAKSDGSSVQVKEEKP